MKKPVTVAVIGAGMRGRYCYSPYSKAHPDEMKIVAVADINPQRLEAFSKEYGIPASACFKSSEEFFKSPRMADIVIISTQDRQHYADTIPALKKGYHILLEKPISPSAQECIEIAEAAEKYNRHVVVCHVLRYTTFYQMMKFYIDSGRIGDVVSMQHIENVGYWHQAHSFVRGNWSNSKASSPMILQKSCHDMDIMLWLSGKNCKRVSSYGSLKHFRPECAPQGAAERCLDCSVRMTCPYNAEKIYLYKYFGCVEPGYWPNQVLSENVTRENIYKALREGPYGRCVYHCDNDVVDHQVVNIEFEDGATASFTMVAFSQDMKRETNIFGTLGEIRGDMEKNKIYVTTFGQPTEEIDVSKYTSDFSGHGGGDNKMMHELLSLIAGEIEESPTLTSVKVSIQSHLMSLAAERSRLENGKSIEINEFYKKN